LDTNNWIQIIFLVGRRDKHEMFEVDSGHVDVPTVYYIKLERQVNKVMIARIFAVLSIDETSSYVQYVVVFH